MAVKLSLGLKGKPNFYFITPLEVSVDIAKKMFEHNRLVTYMYMIVELITGW